MIRAGGPLIRRHWLLHQPRPGLPRALKVQRVENFLSHKSDKSISVHMGWHTGGSFRLKCSSTHVFYTLHATEVGKCINDTDDVDVLAICRF